MNTTTLAPKAALKSGTRTKRNRWGRTKRPEGMTWIHDLGTIDIKPVNFTSGSNPISVGTYNWVPLYIPKDGPRKPTEVQVRFTGQINDGVELLFAQGKNVVDMMSRDKFPEFNVPITWMPREQGEDVPHTRATDIDNCDLILIRGDAAVHLQPSVITRADKFWLVAQETFGGRVVETTAEQAAELKLTPCEVDGKLYIMEPMFGEHRYPGADYLKNFKDVGPQVIERIVRSGASIGTEYAPDEEWADTAKNTKLPAGFEAEKGWKLATVKWFNAVIGYGFAVGTDGKEFRVHFSNVMDEDKHYVVSRNAERPHPGILQPMGAIAYKGKPENGTFKATAVHAIE